MRQSLLTRIVGILLCLASVAGPQEAAAGQQDDAEQLAARDRIIARIDELIQARWQAVGATPAGPTTDEEFLRRVYLDLTGVVPPVADARAFLADTGPDKRARLVDALLESPAHATHMANTWRNVMLPGSVSVEEMANVAGVQNWLRSQFIDNMRYDRMVGDLLVATGGGQSGPALYYTAMELQPEKLAASTARIFLGLQIECAQCHDHPFDHWKQQDFWGYAAFFAQLRRPNMMVPQAAVALVDLPEGEVKLPESEVVVAPRYPTRQPPNDPSLGTRRQQLAVWMASRDNPYLARAAVNRAWAQLFGRGLVEPVDDLGEHNPPSHPELFAELVGYFVDSGFDYRELLRTLARTRSYQLSSRPAGDEVAAPELFASMAVKPLTAEQLYDSLSRALARPAVALASVNGNRLFDQERQSFVARMQSQARSATDYDVGVPQALTMMNGNLVSGATSVGSGILGAIASPLFDDRERLEILFLATLSRMPTDAERALFEQQAGGETAAAHADLLWALLNSAEFTLNH